MNTPSFPEEKLTAYALGELSPAERREVEAELAAHPELQAELEAIQSLAGQLRGDLAAELSEMKDRDPIPFPKNPVEPSHPENDKIISFRRNPWLYATGLLAAAACAALMFLPSLSTQHQGKVFRADTGTVESNLSKTVDELAVPTAAMDLAQVEPLPAEEPEAIAAMAEKMDSVQDLQVAYADARALAVPAAPAATAAPSAGVSGSLAANQPVAQKQLQLAQAELKSSEALRQAPLRAGEKAMEMPQALAAAEKQNLAEASSAAVSAPDSEPLEEIAVSQPAAKKVVSMFGVAVGGNDGSASVDKSLASDARTGGRAPTPSTASSASRGSVQTASQSNTSALYSSNKGESARRNMMVERDQKGSGNFRTDQLKSKVSFSGESYAPITDNTFLRVADQALSTFSIDVDTGSYTNLRRFLNQGELPSPDAVRIEELVNYFNYNYPQPQGEEPFSVNTEVAKAPWKNDHLLVRIGLQGKNVSVADRPPANLVFLIDVSGSMESANKLPLVISSMKLLVQKLKPEDRVGIAVYAGNSGMVLPSTPASKRGEILEALSNLQAGGSTNGAMGIQLAYDMAKAHFIEGGINRVILCTDGDFNVGVTNRGDLVKLIEEKAKSKVFLSVFGFGMGNLQDATLEQLANKGNGNYGYIDNPKEAKRVFVDQVGGTLQTIAKDVKIQVEFNPAVVGSYRLIGYENRMLAARDFNDDKKDAGEIGAGHRVTALYEIIPVGVKDDQASIDPLKYQKAAPPVEYAGDKAEIMNVKLRYKQPEGDASKLLEHPVANQNIRSFNAEKSRWFRSAPETASGDFQFAAGVAAFGMILRDSPYKGDSNFELVLRLTGKGTSDRQEDRTEFIGLVKKARVLRGEETKASGKE